MSMSNHQTHDLTPELTWQIYLVLAAYYSGSSTAVIVVLLFLALLHFLIAGKKR